MAGLLVAACPCYFLIHNDTVNISTYTVTSSAVQPFKERLTSTPYNTLHKSKIVLYMTLLFR